MDQFVLGRRLWNWCDLSWHLLGDLSTGWLDFEISLSQGSFSELCWLGLSHVLDYLKSFVGGHHLNLLGTDYWVDLFLAHFSCQG